MCSRRFAKAGGLLRYGIPDFKMEKRIVDRRVAQMEGEGVTFHYGAHVGVNLPAEQLLADYDAVVLAGGAEKGARPADPGPRARRHPFRHGLPAAAEPARQRRAARTGRREPILAGGKHVVVIGGGDTGSDCIGTSIRQGALSVTNFEIMPQPPERENKLLTWPDWPLKLRTSSSHEEGAERDFAVMTTQVLRRERPSQEAALRARRQQDQADRRHRVRARRRPRAARHGLRASGARGHDQVARPRARSARQRQGRHADAYRSSNPKVFAAGDMRRGQSLVVWAIREGRQCAHAVDKFLMGSTTLPR